MKTDVLLTYTDIINAPIQANLFKIAFNDAFVFERWLPALRSGAYTQGHGFLRKTDNTFCCLGVGCDLMDPGRWKTIPRFVWFGDEGMYYNNEFAAFVGFRSLDGSFRHHTKEHWRLSLTALNDGGGIAPCLSFTEIADIIELHAKEAMQQRGIV